MNQVWLLVAMAPYKAKIVETKRRYSCYVAHILGAALVGALFSLTDPCSDLLEMQAPEIITDWRVFSCSRIFCLLQNTRNGMYIVM